MPMKNCGRLSLTVMQYQYQSSKFFSTWSSHEACDGFTEFLLGHLTKHKSGLRNSGQADELC